MRESVIESEARVMHTGIELLDASRHRGHAVIVALPDPVDGISDVDRDGIGVEREIDDINVDGGQ
jgi:hypothetical protein